MTVNLHWKHVHSTAGDSWHAPFRHILHLKGGYNTGDIAQYENTKAEARRWLHEHLGEPFNLTERDALYLKPIPDWVDEYQWATLGGDGHFYFRNPHDAMMLKLSVMP